MRKFFLFILLLPALAASTQKTVDVGKEPVSFASNQLFTVGGEAYVKTKFARVVEGSAFFAEEFMQGAIILSEGREYKYKLVRLNLIDGQVNYINEQGAELVATTPIREVVFWDTLHKKDHRFVQSDYIEADKKPEKDFYELLQAGAAELYKQHKKALVESQQYGNATYEQRILTELRYFILHNKKWQRIKKLKDLPETLSDKKKELQQFISTQKLSADTEENFEKVVGYYNGLFHQQ